MKKRRDLFFIFLIVFFACGEKSTTSIQGYGKVTVMHFTVDSIPVSGANVIIHHDSTIIIQGLTDINGEFEFQMDTPTDTTVSLFCSYGYLGSEYVGTSIMLIHPADTTDAIILGY